MDTIITSHIQFVNDDEYTFGATLGDTEFFDTEVTVAILDSLPRETVEQYGDTSTEYGDSFFYQAESVALASNVNGNPFEVHIPAFKDSAALAAYLADRDARGIPEEGDSTELTRQGTLSKIQRLNDAIRDIQGDPNIVLWFSTDGSWGGAQDLTFRLASDLTQEERDEWEID